MDIYNDLSKLHRPVSNLFPQHLEKDLENFRLTEEHVQHFHEQGYVSGIKLLDDDQVEQLRKELVEIMDPRHPGHHLLYEYHTNESKDPDRILFHCLGHWRMTPGFHDVLWNPAFTVPASQLLGNSAVRFWHDQLFLKPAKHGGVVAWHQDYSYWTRTKPMQHLTVWVGLDDSTVENGCLRYVPGSHRWGLLKKPTLTGEMMGLKQFLSEEQKMALDDSVPVVLKKGYATFHHPLLVHGSFENNSESPRRAFVLNAFADGTCSDSDEEMLAGVPKIKKGDKMEGQFFPVLFDPLQQENHT